MYYIRPIQIRLFMNRFSRRLDPMKADLVRDEILTLTAEILAEDGNIQILYQEYLSKDDGRNPMGGRLYRRRRQQC